MRLQLPVIRPLRGATKRTLLAAWLVGLVCMSGAEVLPPHAAWLEPDAGDAARVHFQGNPGVPYRLLRSTDLTAWTELGTVEENQRHMMVDDPTPPEDRAFYVVRPDVGTFAPSQLAAAYSAQSGGSAVLVMQSGATVFEDYHNGANADTAIHIASGTKAFFA